MTATETPTTRDQTRAEVKTLLGRLRGCDAATSPEEFDTTVEAITDLALRGRLLEAQELAPEEVAKVVDAGNEDEPVDDDDRKVILSPEEAIAMLADGDTVHVFLNPSGMLIGADWPREEVLDLIRKAEVSELAGKQATGMGHGLAVFMDKKWHFIETKKDIGGAGLGVG